MLYSIIVPSYNRALFLSRAIQSVLDQSYIQWELIIVDDGSTDNTKDTVLPFLKDSRIIYHYQENAERSAARNKGIALAKGDFVCFMDSDEYMLPHHLLNLKNAIEEKGSINAVYHFDIGFDYNNIAKNYIRKGKAFDFPLHPESLFLHLIGAPQLCISACILNEFVFNIDLNAGEDIELLIRISKKYPIVYLPIPCSLFEIEENQRSVNIAMYNVFKRHLKTLNVIFDKSHSYFTISRQTRKREYGNCYLGIAKFHIYQNNTSHALIYILKSLFSNPFANDTLFRINILISTLVSINRAKRIIS